MVASAAELWEKPSLPLRSHCLCLSDPMASRLLGRCAHMLYRSSSRASAAAPATHLPLPAAAPVELQRAKAWPWVTERSMCERTVIRDPYYQVSPTRTQLDDLTDKATVPEDILSAWAQCGGNGNQAAKALIKWAQLVQKTKGEFKEHQSKGMMDSRLVDMMNTLSQQVRNWGGLDLLSSKEVDRNIQRFHASLLRLTAQLSLCIIGGLCVEQLSSECLAHSLEYGRSHRWSGTQFRPDGGSVENPKANVQASGLLGRLGSRQERTAWCGNSEHCA